MVVGWKFPPITAVVVAGVVEKKPPLIGGVDLWSDIVCMETPGRLNKYIARFKKT